MSYTERFSEVHQLLDFIAVDSWTTEQNTGFFSLQNIHRAVVIIATGDMAVGATLDVTIDQATSTAGAGSKALSGKSITQLSAAAGDADDVIIMEIRAEELDVTNNYDCINVRCSPAGAATEFCVLVFGVVQRFVPVSTTLLEEVIT